jgi:hypothetical protein
VAHQRQLEFQHHLGQGRIGESDLGEDAVVADVEDAGRVRSGITIC